MSLNITQLLQTRKAAMNVERQPCGLCTQPTCRDVQLSRDSAAQSSSLLLGENLLPGWTGTPEASKYGMLLTYTWDAPQFTMTSKQSKRQWWPCFREPGKST